MIRGADISNWQGEVSPQIAACLKTHVELVVVRASLEDMTRVGRAQRQIQALQDAGIIVHAYLWLYPSWEPRKTVTDAMREYGSLDIPFWWIDAEEDQDIANPDRNTFCLRETIAALTEAGRRTGIYTAEWWWGQPQHMAGRDDFKDVPLWVANYDNKGDLVGWRPFGGWTRAWGEQFSASGSLCGISPIDLDVFSDEVLSKPEPQPDPRDEQIRQLTASKIGLRDDYTATVETLIAQKQEARNAEARLTKAIRSAQDAIQKWGS